jgi:hypothetical protein
MSVEVAADESGNRVIDRKGQEGVKRVGVRRNVMVEAQETEMKGGRSNVNSDRVI